MKRTALTPKEPKKKRCALPGCEETFLQYNSTIKWCCPEHGAKLALFKRDKEKKREVKEWIKETREKLRTHSYYENLLQIQINTIVRLLDTGTLCISCNAQISEQGHDQTGKPQASHRHSVGSNNSIRFNLHNNHRSCYRCNSMMSGNIDGYDKGLKERYGEEYLEYVKYGIVRDYQFIKMSKDELLEKIKICRQIIKTYEPVLLTPEQRISERKRLNELIGIYT